MEHEHKAHPRFSASMAFLLNNPIRRWSDHSPQKFIRLLEVQRNWAVMDFGCGPGFYTIPFARAAGRVVAVDVQPEMLRKAAAYAGKAGVKVESVESDGVRIPLPDSSFDLVFLSHVYHEIEDKRGALLEFRRLLKVGGRVAVREKTEKTWFPLGPPVIPVATIESGLGDAGFGQVSTVGGGGSRIVLGVKQHSS